MNPFAPGELPSGTVLRGTYEISSVLGRGGMGTVFLARHLRLPGKQVAIKVLHSSEELPPDVHVRFRREAEIASRLGHPNIVEVLDFDTLEDGSPFMVMEYLRGEGLSRRLRRQRRLPLEEALTFAREMGSALQAAHRAGVVHRDLKPGNVFLVPTESGGRVGERVKLLDFGISKLLDSRTVQTQEAVLMGTPQYMAPEQAQGRNSDVDVRTDLFSFGCIVYEMLAGQPAFPGGSLPELIYQIVHEPPEPLASLAPELPAHVVEAVERAMQKRPDERWPDVGAFIHALTGSPLQTLPPASSTPEFRPPRIVAPEEARPTAAARPRPASDVAEPRATPSGQAHPASDVAESRATASGPERPAPSAESLSAPAGPVTAPTVSARPRLQNASPPEAMPLPDLRHTGGRSKHLPALIAAATVALVGGAAFVLWPKPTASPTPPPSPGVQAVAARPPEPAAGTTVPTPPTTTAAPESRPPEQDAEAAPSHPEPAPSAVATASEPETSTRQEAPVRKPASSKAPTAERMPEAARQDLAAAEQALTAGNATEAIRLIRRSQRVRLTGTSFALLTRAHCRRGDLGGAKAAWPDVPSTERVRVRGYCKQYEIDL